MRFKQVMAALGKAACYVLLFFGVQLFVSYAMLFAQGIQAGIEAALSGSMPDVDALAMQLSEDLLANAATLTLIANAATLVLLVPVFAAQKKRYAHEISLTPIKSRAVAPLAVGAVSIAAFVAMLLSLLPIPEEVLESYADASASLGAPGLLSAVATVLVAPIAEEVIFRGLVYTRLRRAMPAWVAAVVSSLVFGALHGQIIWIAYAFVMGVALTLVFERTGSLWASIIVHVTFNFAGTYIVPYLPANALILAAAATGVGISWAWLARLYPAHKKEV